jgi:hypothetical protein
MAVEARIANIRRSQVAAVAVGSLGSIVMLAGLVGRSVLVAWGGFAMFVTALSTVVTLGIWAWWLARRIANPEQ